MASGVSGVADGVTIATGDTYFCIRKVKSKYFLSLSLPLSFTLTHYLSIYPSIYLSLYMYIPGDGVVVDVDKDDARADAAVADKAVQHLSEQQSTSPRGLESACSSDTLFLGRYSRR